MEDPIDPDLLRIPVGPGALHVERYGRGGTPVVLLHGFGTSSFLWRTIGPELAAERYTALAIDLLGHGESDRPLDTDFGFASQADYVDRALTALRVTRAPIVGVDLGGAVALRLASIHPERVTQLVLVNPLTPDSTPADDVRGLARNTARNALRVASGILGAAALLKPLLQESVADPAAMPDRLVARYLAPYVGQEGVNHLLSLARDVRADDWEDVELGSVRVPALVIRGERDRWLEDDVADRLSAALPQSRLIRLPDVARLVPEEAPDQLVGLIIDWISGAAGVSLG